MAFNRAVSQDTQSRCVCVCARACDIFAKELWNNMGLCCFYAGQYDLTLSCFERALMLADDDNMADVWYNIGQVWM